MALNIAITGVGVVSALGQTPAELADRLARDEIAVEEVPWTRDDPSRAEWWAPVRDFDPTRWLEAKTIEGTDPFAQYGLAATAMAIEDAGIGSFDPVRTAVIIGTAKSATQTFEHTQYLADRHGRDAVTSKLMLKVWPNMCASQIAMRWGLHGISLTVSTGCASALDAIGLGARMIQSGMADVALVGGVEGGVALGVGEDGFVPASAWSRDAFGMCPHTKDPRKACQPFDRNRSGMVFGEGAACFVLESAEHAAARGARPQAWVQGWGNLADGFHPSTPEPSGIWEKRAMELAQAEAGIEPATIDALAAHGTGTPKGDIAEIRAVNNLFRGRSKPLPANSIKGTLGHPTGSAGALNLVMGLEAMRTGTFVHTGCTVDPDPEIEFDLVLEKPRQIDIEWLQVNAFGFGGQNASLVVSARPS